MKPGLFFTFEGTEGTGKSTQAGMLAEALGAHGHRVILTREPGGTPFGKRLRGILLDPSSVGIDRYAELFCYLADRAQHVSEVIAPALQGGACVICDRFTDATLAYQGDGRGLDATFLREANRRAAGPCVPDRTFLLAFQRVECGLERACARQRADGTSGLEDRFEREEMSFHRRVQEGYRRLAEGEPERFVLLPADLDAARLHELILAAAVEAIAARGGARG